MKHIMHLRSKYFNLVNCDKKSIEIRLADEKRKNFKVGDVIVFYELSHDDNYTSVLIDSIKKYSTFEELLSDNDINDLGINILGKSNFIQELKEIYPTDTVTKYGLLGIKFHVMR